MKNDERFPFIRTGAIGLLTMFFLFLSTINTSGQYFSFTPSDYASVNTPTITPTITGDVMNTDILLPAITKGTDFTFILAYHDVTAPIDYLDPPFTDGAWSEPLPFGDELFDDIKTIHITPAHYSDPALLLDDGFGGLEFRIMIDVSFNSGMGFQLVNVIIPVVSPPKKLVFVLDKSGSMRGPSCTNTSGTISRWEALIGSVDGFLKLLVPTGVSQDQVRIILYDYEVHEMDVFAGGAFVNLPTDQAGIDALIAPYMPPFLPAGTTAIGKGLMNGCTDIRNASTGSENLFVVLFTDGQQNVIPLVDISGTQVNDTPAFLFNDAASTDPEVSIITTGTGDYLPVANDLLNSIAYQNNGIYVTSESGGLCEFDFEGYNDIFGNVLVEILDGGSLKLMSKRTSSIGDPTEDHSYTVNDRITQIVFQLNTDDVSDNDLVVKKDGVDVSAFMRTLSTRNTLVSYLGPEFFDSLDIDIKGDWICEPMGEEGDNYIMKVFVDDHFFDVEPLIDAGDGSAGNPLALEVILNYQGEILTGGNFDVKAFVTGPAFDLGDALANADIAVDSLDPDVTDPAVQKYLEFMGSDQGMEFMGIESMMVDMIDDGTGVYRGTFSGTEETGLYKVVYFVEGSIEEIGHIERIDQRVTNIWFGDVEEEDLNYTVDHDPLKKMAVVSIRPVNKFGYNMSPGLLPWITIKTGDGNADLVNRRDNLDGSYSFFFANVADLITENIKIQVKNSVYYDGSVSGPDECNIPIWMWAILLVIFLYVLLKIFVKNLRTQKPSVWVYVLALIVWGLICLNQCLNLVPWSF